MVAVGEASRGQDPHQRWENAAALQKSLMKFHGRSLAVDKGSGNDAEVNKDKKARDD